MEHYPFVIERPYGRVEVVLEIYGAGGEVIASIFDLRGKINLRPMSKRWYAVVRGHLHRIERIVKEAGCREMRMDGRRWSRVLPEYEPVEGFPNRLRKVL